MEARIAFGAVITFVVICFIIANHMGWVETKRNNQKLQRDIDALRKKSKDFLQKGWNYKEVAGLFGLDRTTANHAEKKVNELIYTKYPAWAYEIYLTVNSKPPLQDELFGISKETIECVASM